MVVTDRQPRRDPAVEAAEVLADALADRLRRLEAVARLRGVDADALRRAVIDGDEDAYLALVDDHGRRHVRAPHLVGAFGQDRAVVGLRAVKMADPLRVLEALLA